jgi:hypothetical protein
VLFNIFFFFWLSWFSPFTHSFRDLFSFVHQVQQKCWGFEARQGKTPSAYQKWLHMYVRMHASNPAGIIRFRWEVCTKIYTTIKPVNTLLKFLFPSYFDNTYQGDQMSLWKDCPEGCQDHFWWKLWINFYRWRE